MSYNQRFSLGKKQQEKESLPVQNMLMTSVLTLPNTTENTGFNTVLTRKSRAEQASVGHGGGREEDRL